MSIRKRATMSSEIRVSKIVWVCPSCGNTEIGGGKRKCKKCKTEMQSSGKE